MSTLTLEGLRPIPLAHYLKALGVLRVVGGQLDAQVRGAWSGDTFALHGGLTADALRHFLLHTYAPTPLLAPWNGGSGFHPKDNKVAVTALREGAAPRFAAYRGAIAAADACLAALCLDEKASGDEKKRLLELCRGRFPDDALPWLDAAFVLTDAGAKYPPLLGTGGNDGRLEFTNNFMQRLIDLFDPQTGAPSDDAAAWLDAALFDAPAAGLQRSNPIGQFYPGAAGGPNQTASFDGDAVINPWDFVLMLEGAVLFAAASVRRLGDAGPGVLSFPFAVRQAAVGYGSAADEDERQARAEMWLPLWSEPATLRTIGALLSEGRAQVGARHARDGVDFARAIAGLGVDRGIQAFERYGFQMRNGRTFFATPLGRWAVRREPDADLLLDIDSWLQRFRDKALSAQAPASVGRAARQLERVILALCEGQGAEAVQATVIALGACEREMACSQKWTASAFLKPVPPLSPRWLDAMGVATTEVRVAAALASLHGRLEPGGRGAIVPLRQHLEPVRLTAWRSGARAVFTDEPSRDRVWRAGDLIGSLGAILQRRMMEASRTGLGALTDEGVAFVDSEDVATFIAGRVDDRRIEALLWGLILLDWPAAAPRRLPSPGGEAGPGPLYAAMKLCLTLSGQGGEPIPLDAAMIRHAVVGDGPRAATLALRRLRASGHPPAALALPASTQEARRTAAGLLIPLRRGALGGLRQRVLQRPHADRTGPDAGALAPDAAQT